VMFTSEKLKSIVVPIVEETTGRPVTINTIPLSVFPFYSRQDGRIQYSKPSGGRILFQLVPRTRCSSCQCQNPAIIQVAY
jgi:hypothetical protein